MSVIDRLAEWGPHEIGIRGLFPSAFQYTGERRVFDQPLVIMAFTNRCGSNLLGEYLRSTGKLGGFFEQLNSDIVEKTSARIGAQSFPDYIEKLVAAAEGKTYGFKASWDQIAMLLRGRIDRMFDGVKIIHSQRNDVMAQAVSFSIADTTKQWTSRQKPRKSAEVVFDYTDIAGRLSATLFANSAIEFLSRLYEFPRLEISYESLVSNAARELREVSGFLQIDFEGWQPGETSIKRQFSDLNQIMIEDFNAASRRMVAPL